MKPWVKKAGLFIYSTLITSYFGFVCSATLGLGGGYLLQAGVAILVAAGVINPVSGPIFIATIALFTLGGLLGAGIGIKWTYPLFKEKVIEDKNTEIPVEPQHQEKLVENKSKPSTTIAGNACTQNIFRKAVSPAYIPAIETQDRKNTLRSKL